MGGFESLAANPNAGGNWNLGAWGGTGGQSGAFNFGGAGGGSGFNLGNFGSGLAGAGNILGSIGGFYLGMKQYKMAKQQLAESKRQFNLQFNAQKGLINTRLEDRQRARVASNPNAYVSVGEYMDKHGVK